MADTLTLHLSEDAWNGDALFAVLVDGTEIGGPSSVTTAHSTGAFQDFTYTGDFGAGFHTVEVQFLNDAWGGTADTDRNLYVGGITFNGIDYAGASAQDNAAHGHQADDPAAAVMDVNGSTVFDGVGSASPPPPPVTGESQHTLTVYLAEDAWNGDAQFSLDVDGQQVFDPTAVTVTHGDGFQQFTYTGLLPDDPQAINVHFLNDAWGGTATTDRNLYVGAVYFDGFIASGQTAQNDAMAGGADTDPNAAEMYVNGTVTFPNITNGPTGHPPPGDVPMTLHLSEDAWNGDAQFTVDLDGTQIMGPKAVSVAHDSGGYQDFTLYIPDAPGTHTLSVHFLNDGWGGTSATDRNLYVNSVDINGVHFAGSTAANDAANGNQAADPTAAVMDVNGTATFTFDHAQLIA